MKREKHRGKTRVGAKLAQAPVSPSLIESPTATITGLITFLAAVLLVAGANVPWLLVAAAVILPCGIVSALNPRWAADRGIFFRRPALFTAAFGYLVVFAVGALGGTIDDAVIYVIIGGITTLVGFAFPKNGYPEWFLALFGPDTRE